LKKTHYYILFTAILTIASTSMYILHYAIFNDAHSLFFYLIMDLAFMPLEILLVTVVFDRVLEIREKKSILRKLNMVIGVFFTEVGTEVFKAFINQDKNAENLKSISIISGNWKSKDFTNLLKTVEPFSFKNEISAPCLIELKELICSKRGFILKIMENPILIEHELFSELLLALMHLDSELMYRKDLTNLKPHDADHIFHDISRTYKLFYQSWVRYMEHLKTEYPYMFSLSVRTNPFDENARVEID